MTFVRSEGMKITLTPKQAKMLSTKETIKKIIKENPDTVMAFDIFDGKDLIGFVLVHRFKKRKYFLWEYAIDVKCQNQHKGTKALKEFLGLMKESYDAKEITTTYIFGNEQAKHVYEKVGFVETDVVDEPGCHEVNMAYYYKKDGEATSMKQKIKISLKKITYENVNDIRKLRVAKDQRDFVADNDWSLIQAYLSLAEGEPVFPFGIYNGKTLVGFIMISYSNNWKGYGRDAWLKSAAYKHYKGKYYYYIWRFMIDKKYQNRGYGRAAMKRAIDFVKTSPCGKADYCVLSYEPKNEVAKKLYFSLGFEEINGPGYYEEDDEISAALKL